MNFVEKGIIELIKKSKVPNKFLFKRLSVDGYVELCKTSSKYINVYFEYLSDKVALDFFYKYLDRLLENDLPNLYSGKYLVELFRFASRHNIINDLIDNHPELFIKYILRNDYSLYPYSFRIKDKVSSNKIFNFLKQNIDKIEKVYSNSIFFQLLEKLSDDEKFEIIMNDNFIIYEFDLWRIKELFNDYDKIKKCFDKYAKKTERIYVYRVFETLKREDALNFIIDDLKENRKVHIDTEDFLVFNDKEKLRIVEKLGEKVLLNLKFYMDFYFTNEEKEITIEKILNLLKVLPYDQIKLYDCTYFILEAISNLKTEDLYAFFEKCDNEVIASDLLENNIKILENRDILLYFLNNYKESVFNALNKNLNCLWSFSDNEEIVDYFISCDSRHIESFDFTENQINDINYIKERIKVNPQVLFYFLQKNFDIKLVEFAFECNYRPERCVYNLLIKRNVYLEEWKSYFKNFNFEKEEFANVWNEFIGIPNEEFNEFLLYKAAEFNNQSLDDFKLKFKNLKKTNANLINTLDYRLLSDRFSFLKINQLEMLSVYKDVAYRFANLSDKKIMVISKILEMSSSLNWIDLIDRIIGHINEYDDLIDDVYNKDLSVDELNNLIFVLTRPDYFEIKKHEDLLNVRNKLGKKFTKLLSLNNLVGYRTIVSVSLFGVDFYELARLNSVYCSDLENLRKCDINGEILDVMQFINYFCSIDDVEELKEIYKNSPVLLTDPIFIVDLENEFKRVFAHLYNSSLYHVEKNDKVLSVDYLDKQIDVYSPIGLEDDYQKQFGLMISSIGAYSAQKSVPDDYYDNWNIDLIESHGVCCSYLENDNLGTARICHACLGFTDYSPDALLLSAPYDIGSSSANLKFNTSRHIDTMFMTPRGMINATRHTHNEVVWERRDLSEYAKVFKKQPSYIVFFCGNFSEMTDEEKKVFESTKQAAAQLGTEDGKGLPIVLVERKKIAIYQSNLLNTEIKKFITNYEYGDLAAIFLRYYNNNSGSKYYHKEIENAYFGTEKLNYIKQVITNSVFSAKETENFDKIRIIKQELSEIIENERCNGNNMKFDEIMSIIDMSLFLEKCKDSKYLTKLIKAILNIPYDDDCTKRWKQENDSLENCDYQKSNLFSFASSVFSENSTMCEMFLKKATELENLHLYKDNTIFDNRYVINKIFYTLMQIHNQPASTFINDRISMGDVVNEIKLKEYAMDAIIYQTCSYADDDSKKNLRSSIEKAKLLMKEKNYTEEQIQNVLVIMIMCSVPSLEDEKIKIELEEYGLSGVEYSSKIEVAKAIKNANVLEHIRFVKGAPFNKAYLSEDFDNNALIKQVYQLQESYAINDIKDYVKENPETKQAIDEALKTLNPQMVIRLIRKGRFKLLKKEIGFEQAMMHIDSEKMLDPCNVLIDKMLSYENLSSQISIQDFYNYVLKMPYYKELLEKIYNRENLYLNLSKVHGETHADNVSLFATYIANKEGMSELDIKTIQEAALYHDIGRSNDGNDIYHGASGADKYSNRVSTPDDISSKEVQFLIEAHALFRVGNVRNLFNVYGFEEKDYDRLYKMATIVRDADALDRTRFALTEKTNNLDISYLINDSSKEIIMAVQQINNIIYADYIRSLQEGVELGDSYGKK